MEQHRQPQRLAEAIAIGGRELQLGRERIEHARRDRHRAQPMRVTRVRRSGKGEVREAQLLHVAEPLILRAVDQRSFVGGDLDRAVNGIADVHRAAM